MKASGENTEEFLRTELADMVIKAEAYGGYHVNVFVSPSASYKNSGEQNGFEGEH